MPRRTPAGPSAAKPATRRRNGKPCHGAPGVELSGKSLVHEAERPGAAAAQRLRAAAPILTVNNIEVIYTRVVLVLKGVSLEVPRGGFVAILGANGAGKTTPLKA